MSRRRLDDGSGVRGGRRISCAIRLSEKSLWLISRRNRKIATTGREKTASPLLTPNEKNPGKTHNPINSRVSPRLREPTSRRKMAIRAASPLPVKTISDGDACRSTATCSRARSRACRARAPRTWADDGLPIGVQLVGGYGREDVLIRLAYAYEQATGHRRPGRMPLSLDLANA